MKITLRLEKTFTIDLDAKNTESAAIREMIINRLSENEDNITDGEVVLDSTTVHDEVREILSDDMDSLLELDINETDFTITITD